MNSYIEDELKNVLEKISNLADINGDDFIKEIKKIKGFNCLTNYFRHEFMQDIINSAYNLSIFDLYKNIFDNIINYYNRQTASYNRHADNEKLLRNKELLKNIIDKVNNLIGMQDSEFEPLIIKALGDKINKIKAEILKSGA
jgi:hypothetical protein